MGRSSLASEGHGRTDKIENIFLPTKYFSTDQIFLYFSSDIVKNRQ